jgi:hypothetical protein
MTELWAPSSAIRERARLAHPATPEPTIDDVLWYLDHAAKDLRIAFENVSRFAKSVREAFRGKRGRRRRAEPSVPPCACCGRPCNLERANTGGPLRCDWCMSHCRMVTGLHLAQPGEHRQICSDGGLLHDMKGNPSCPSCGYTPKLVEPGPTEGRYEPTEETDEP